MWKKLAQKLMSGINYNHPHKAHMGFIGVVCQEAEEFLVFFHRLPLSLLRYLQLCTEWLVGIVGWGLGFTSLWRLGRGGRAKQVHKCTFCYMCKTYMCECTYVHVEDGNTEALTH